MGAHDVGLVQPEPQNNVQKNVYPQPRQAEPKQPLAHAAKQSYHEKHHHESLHGVEKPMLVVHNNRARDKQIFQ